MKPSDSRWPEEFDLLGLIDNFAHYGTRRIHVLHRRLTPGPSELQGILEGPGESAGGGVRFSLPSPSLL